MSFAQAFGVPIVTFLGILGGWQLAMLGVGALAAATMILILLSVPVNTRFQAGSLATLLQAFGNGRLLMLVSVTGLFCTAYTILFTLLSAIAPKSET